MSGIDDCPVVLLFVKGLGVVKIWRGFTRAGRVVATVHLAQARMFARWQDREIAAIERRLKRKGYDVWRRRLWYVAEPVE